MTYPNPKKVKYGPDFFPQKQKKEEKDDIDSMTCFNPKRVTYDVQREKLKQEFSAANINLMNERRTQMDQQILLWALFSFNNVENGACGGVYEILQGEDIIYISGIPKFVHVRDALNTHFSGEDDLPLGRYLLQVGSGSWRNFYVRFLMSPNPREDVVTKALSIEKQRRFAEI